MPDPVTGTIALVGGLGKSYMEKEGARKAGRAQMQAADVARGDIERTYDISKGYYQPYYDTGTAASNRLAQNLGIGGDVNAPDYGLLTRGFSAADLQQDPGYQFRVNQALKVLGRNAAARGGMLSGQTLLGATTRASELGAQEYGSAYDRYRQRQQDIYNMLYGQQRLGAQTAGSLADLSSSYGANLANIALGKGNIEAQKTAGEYGAYGAGVNALTDWAMQKYGKTPDTTQVPEIGLKGAARSSVYGPITLFPGQK